jgi:hypothetical protein
MYFRYILECQKIETKSLQVHLHVLHACHVACVKKQNSELKIIFFTR